MKIKIILIAMLVLPLLMGAGCKKGNNSYLTVEATIKDHGNTSTDGW